MTAGWCSQMILIVLNHQTGHLAHLIMDYSIRGALQQLVYRQKFKNCDHLKQVLNSCWDMISQEPINGAIDKWSKRPLTVVCRLNALNIG